MKSVKILLFDNYDSFTYNLVHVIKSLGYEDVDVYRNDKIELSQIDQYDKIILSPGPGIPYEAGLMMQLIEQYADKKSILGVCLGHQAIGEAFGGTLENIPTVFHGVQTAINIVSEDYIFAGLPKQIQAGRYHSWIVSNKNLPADIEVTAIDDQGDIMALKHKKFDLHGVQFHPESILTPDGKRIIQNFIEFIK